MGVRLFGIDIAGLIRATVAPGLLPARLLQKSVSALDPADPTAEPTVSYRAFPCSGVEDDSKETLARGTQVEQGSRRILLVAETLPASISPVAGDRIELNGETLEIVGDGVSSDPAGATYLCHCRA